MSPETSSGTNPDPTGVLSERADGLALVLSRTYPASVADVWDCVTESERLSRWFGEWGGDPAEGFVLLRMTAEGQDVAAVRCDIVACDPPWLLQVRTTGEYGTWDLLLELTEPTLAAGRTTVTFSQLRVEPEALADVGPGWEYYLDRLGAAIVGTPADAVVWDDYHPEQSEYYARLAATPRAQM